MEKTLGLLLMICLGFALQKKIGHPDQLKGLKVIILSLALPATIFVALLGVHLDSSLLTLPFVGLGINLFLLLIFSLVNPLLNLNDSSRKRTTLMLIPSLAPGLSCFPFISEYLGDEPLAFAALMDVGNKLFVLIILYLIAMRWYFQLNTLPKESKRKDLVQMLKKMAFEPINLIMILAFVLLSLGINLSSLPSVISSTFLRLSGIMAPLILLFIGLAVKIKRSEVGAILKLLTIRSGILFLGSALFIHLVPELSPSIILLAIVFPQSSCSFWPFAHMSLINSQEKASVKTFDLEFALSVLACSLPFSSLMIMGVFSFPILSIQPLVIGSLGCLMVLFSFIPHLVKLLKRVQLGSRRRLAGAK